MIKKYWNIFILNLLVLSLSVGCSKTKMVGSDEGLLDAEETVKEITSKEFEQAKKREEIIKSGQGPSMTLMVYMIGSDLYSNLPLEMKSKHHYFCCKENFRNSY